MARTAYTKAQVHKLLQRIDRLEWFVSTLQHALGVQATLKASRSIQKGPIRLTFQVTISDEAWCELLRAPAMRQSLIEQVADELERQLEEWINNLETDIQR